MNSCLRRDKSGIESGNFAGRLLFISYFISYYISYLAVVRLGTQAIIADWIITT